MPRKKQFDVDDVREKAMVAFWDHGYRATSLEDLTDCMGINRTSLYDTFGDKYALFIEALHNYNRTHSTPYFTGKMKAYSPRQAILSIFEDCSDQIRNADERNGCLMINTALELSPHDEKVAQIVNQSFVSLERNIFRKLIKQGQANGEISTSVDPATLSHTLLSLFIGLKVLSRNPHQDKTLANAIKNQVVALLPPRENAPPPHPPLLQEPEA